MDLRRADSRSAVFDARALFVNKHGKRLSSRVMVTYEQGLRGVWNLLRIQYDISRRLSVRAQTGSESALDLLYRFSFD